MRHLKTTLIIHITVPIHLVHLVIHQRFSDQTVHSRHVRRREPVRIKFARTTEYDQFAVFPLQKWKQIAGVDDLRQIWVFTVQVSEPVRVQLADDEITFQHLASLGDAELFRAQKPKQKWCIYNKILDLNFCFC